MFSCTTRTILLAPLHGRCFWSLRVQSEEDELPTEDIGSIYVCAPGWYIVMLALCALHNIIINGKERQNEARIRVLVCPPPPLLRRHQRPEPSLMSVRFFVTAFDPFFFIYRL